MIISESGSAPGVGPIHKDEIAPTLEPISKLLGIDLVKQALGSVGKKQFSGDIDCAIDIKPEQLPEFQKKLESSPLFSYVEKTSVFITAIEIQNYDPNRTYVDPQTGEDKGPPAGRTGKVQLDFMPGNPGWMKTYYHSPGEKESKYKGVFRNIMIATICAIYQRDASEEKIDDGRPLEVERWMWAPDKGLVRIKRVPKPKAKGDGYTKANLNTVINKPIQTAPEIASTLGLDGPEDLNSYESLKAAIEKNYDPAMVDKILNSFANNKQVIDIGVPDDIADRVEQKAESLADKHLRRLKELLP